MEKRRQPEVIAGRVNADGSIAAGDGFTVSKPGTGAYTITFLGGFRPVAINVTPAGNSSRFAYTQTSTPANGNAWTVVIANTAATAADDAFHFTAVGVQV